MIKPRALRFGDTLGLIAPASNTTEENVEKSIKTLVELGFKVKEGKSLYKRHGFLAGDDEIRAQDINDMFGDKEVDGIICIRAAPRSQDTGNDRLRDRQEQPKGVHRV